MNKITIKNLTNGNLVIDVGGNTKVYLDQEDHSTEEISEGEFRNIHISLFSHGYVGIVPQSDPNIRAGNEIVLWKMSGNFSLSDLFNLSTNVEANNLVSELDFIVSKGALEYLVKKDLIKHFLNVKFKIGEEKTNNFEYIMIKPFNCLSRASRVAEYYFVL